MNSGGVRWGAPFNSESVSRGAGLGRTTICSERPWALHRAINTPQNIPGPEFGNAATVKFSASQPLNIWGRAVISRAHSELISAQKRLNAFFLNCLPQNLMDPCSQSIPPPASLWSAAALESHALERCPTSVTRRQLRGGQGQRAAWAPPCQCPNPAQGIADGGGRSPTLFRPQPRSIMADWRPSSALRICLTCARPPHTHT